MTLSLHSVSELVNLYNSERSEESHSFPLTFRERAGVRGKHQRDYSGDVT